MTQDRLATIAYLLKLTWHKTITFQRFPKRKPDNNNLKLGLVFCLFAVFFKLIFEAVSIFAPKKFGIFIIIRP